MKQSQYLNDYLDYNTKAERKLTTGTFLAYRLKGSARSYSGRYKTALENGIDRLIRTGQAKQVTSALGRTVYTSPIEARILCPESQV